jgi:hypothetical protein
VFFNFFFPDFNKYTVYLEVSLSPTKCTNSVYLTSVLSLASQEARLYVFAFIKREIVVF